MPVLRERIETSLGMEEAFAFVADFGNASRWDPGVATSEPVDARPTGVGSRYRLGIRMAGRVTPMEYEITRFESPSRVVLAGRGSGVRAVDDISFAPTPTGTRIDYVADIRLEGLLRIIEPLAGGSFRRIAENARDGMRRTLDDLARRPAATPAPGSAPASAARA